MKSYTLRIYRNFVKHAGYGGVDHLRRKDLDRGISEFRDYITPNGSDTISSVHAPVANGTSSYDGKLDDVPSGVFDSSIVNAYRRPNETFEQANSRIRSYLQGSFAQDRYHGVEQLMGMVMNPAVGAFDPSGKLTESGTRGVGVMTRESPWVIRKFAPGVIEDTIPRLFSRDKSGSGLKLTPAGTNFVDTVVSDYGLDSVAKTLQNRYVSNARVASR